MSFWEKAKKYVSKTGNTTARIAEKTGTAIGTGIGTAAMYGARKANEVYQRRWGPEGREARIEGYKAKAEELRAKAQYYRAKNSLRTSSVKSTNIFGEKLAQSISGGKPSAPNYDYLVGKKPKKFKMKEFEI